MGLSLFHRNDIVLYGLVLPLSIVCLYWRVKAKESKKNMYKNLPQPEGAWPIIGHLLLLRQQHQLTHRALGTLADKYGPAFGIRLGVNDVFVVSNWEVAKECFTINDKVLSSRPKNFVVTLIGYADLSFGFAPYGQHWRDMRKMAMTWLFSSHRLESRRDIRETEINSLVKGLYEECVEHDGSTVEMKDRFWRFALNIILRSVAGNGSLADDAELRRCEKKISYLNRMAGQLFIADVIPFLGWLDTLSGSVGRVKRAANELDNFLQRWVEEHRNDRPIREIEGRKPDFIDAMLSALDDGRPTEEVDRIIKAECLGVVVAGSDTTALTLTWTISLLLNNNHILKKAHNELDVNIGKNRQVEESDLNNLGYIKAIIKETLRLYPTAPLSLPRVATEDCKVAGFNIPKGTQLLVNLWKIHRDPTVWKNPCEYIPERFPGEHAHSDVKGQDFEYMPFGSGRRICPGITFASQVLHLALARLLHAFEFRTVSDKPMDMTEGAGLTLPKDTPLEVILTPRLPAKLYVK